MGRRVLRAQCSARVLSRSRPALKHRRKAFAGLRSCHQRKVFFHSYLSSPYFFRHQSENSICLQRPSCSALHLAKSLFSSELQTQTNVLIRLWSCQPRNVLFHSYLFLPLFPSSVGKLALSAAPLSLVSPSRKLLRRAFLRSHPY